MNYLRTRIVPEKAVGVSGFLVLDIDGDLRGLDIRNGIAEFVEDIESNYREPTEVLTISSADFGKYYSGQKKAVDIAPSDSLLHLFEEFEVKPMY